jgi:hypothetical protein
VHSAYALARIRGDDEPCYLDLQLLYTMAPRPCVVSVVALRLLGDPARIDMRFHISGTHLTTLPSHDVELIAPLVMLFVLFIVPLAHTM